jgi:signal transduction histidine kinase
MHFDDRLATVLRNPASSPATARALFRQLLDLLGTLPDDARSEGIDAAYLRLGGLAAAIPAHERAAILREPVLRLRAPRLVAQLALAEPAVASMAMARAELSDEQWLDLIPALPVRARGFVRHHRALSSRAEALLARLGIGDRGLPGVAGPDTSTDEAPHDSIVAETAPEPDPAPPPEPQAEPLPEPLPEPERVSRPSPPERDTEEPPHIDEIGAIVRRIEAFRKTRAAEHDLTADDAPLLAREIRVPPRAVAAFDFATDAEGRVVWADSAVAPAAAGLRLAARDPDSPVQSSPALLAAFRHRQPIVRAALTIDGAPAVAGEWRVDAAPRFDQPNGRFVGYIGRLRRPASPSARAIPAHHGEADRMRQILHELRTPVNAVQGFAEVIQQQLFGPTPHDYRALAATIAGDSARMLAGFDELDRLVKLDSGAMALDPGECDLLPLLRATLAQLDSFHKPRRSAMPLECDAPALPVLMARAEAERFVWRLLATLAGATGPGEVLRLRARQRDDGVRLSLRLPMSLALRDGDALFHTAPSAQPQALAAGMFGAGFALRLAAAEAKAAGGFLERRGDKLRIRLPSNAANATDARDTAEQDDETRPAGFVPGNL